MGFDGRWFELLGLKEDRIVWEYKISTSSCLCRAVLPLSRMICLYFKQEI